jgi:hypothetical protein
VGNRPDQFHVTTVAQLVSCDSVCDFRFKKITFLLNNSFQLYKTDFMQIVSSACDQPKRTRFLYLEHRFEKNVKMVIIV